MSQTKFGRIRQNTEIVFNYANIIIYYVPYLIIFLLFAYFCKTAANRILKKKFRNEPNLTTNRADGSKTFGNPGPCANHESKKKNILFKHI